MNNQSPSPDHRKSDLNQNQIVPPLDTSSTPQNHLLTLSGQDQAVAPEIQVGVEGVGNDLGAKCVDKIEINH